MEKDYATILEAAAKYLEAIPFSEERWGTNGITMSNAMKNIIQDIRDVAAYLQSPPQPNDEVVGIIRLMNKPITFDVVLCSKCRTQYDSKRYSSCPVCC